MLTTDYVAGSPNWLELTTPDPDTAAAFYHAVFDWQTHPTNTHTHTLFRHDCATVAALTTPTDDNTDPAWTVFFHTTDLDATTATAEKAGATIDIAPTDHDAAGRLAHLTDPQGARFALRQPAETGDLEKLGAPAALCWLELDSRDAAAFTFYRTVFDWHTEAFDVPGTSYTLLSTAETHPHRTAFGHEQLAADHPPRWLPYIWVDDVDATAARIDEHGGTLLTPATHAAYLGRIAVAADPAGARFAITTPESD